jgi:hypothetical protein
MSDRISLRRIFDLAVTLAVLAGGAVGLVYAIAIATTLQELRTLEPITLDGHPDLEIWRCPTAQGSPSSLPADAESRPTVERSANCLPGARQARPQ